MVAITAQRKTFSGRGGRPRKPGPREPNGQPQRALKQETEAEVISVVLAQPHRQGDRDQRRTDVVWRLIVSGRVKHNDVSNNDLWRAFDLYLRAKRALSGPEASKRPFAVIDGGGASFWDADPAANTEEWEAMRDARDLVKARFASAGRALRDCGAMVEKAVDAMTDAHPDMDERVVAFWIAHALPTGLAALAKHFGLVK